MDVERRIKIEEAIYKVYEKEQADDLINALPKVAYHNGRQVLLEVKRKWNNEKFYEVFHYNHRNVWECVKTLTKEICDVDTLSRIRGEQNIGYAQTLANEICEYIYAKKKDYNSKHGSYHYDKNGYVKE